MWFLNLSSPIFFSDVWFYWSLSYCVTWHKIMAHHYFISSRHPLSCPPLLRCLPASLVTPLFLCPFSTFGSSRTAFSSNIRVSQLWWIKTIWVRMHVLQCSVRACVCACASVWYIKKGACTASISGSHSAPNINHHQFPRHIQESWQEMPQCSQDAACAEGATSCMVILQTLLWCEFNNLNIAKIFSWIIWPCLQY